MILASEEKIRAFTDKGWWGTTTFDTLFRANVERHPQAIAVVDPLNRAEITDGEPKRVTYVELETMVNRLASTLLSQGLRQDDIIGVQLPNIVELVAVYLAAARLGLIVTPFPVQYREFELEQMLSFVEAKAFLTAGRIGPQQHAAMLVGLNPKLPNLEKILAFGDNLPEGVIGLNELLAQEADPTLLDAYLKEISPTANDVFTICWTSGTEGRPKGVPRTANEWLISAYGTVDGAELVEGCVMLNPFPMVNMAGIGGMLIPWLLTGGKLVQHHPLSLPVFMKQIAVEKIEYTVAPPALLNMLLQNEALLANADLSSIKTIGSGSAPLSPWMVKTWQERFGIRVINYFGSNEGATIVSGPQEMSDPEKRALYFPRFGVEGFGWTARVAQRMQSKLVDLATRAEITEAGQPGELLLKGASVFPGYYNAPDLTARVFDDDGFFHTGDMFELAGDGDDLRYYHYVGRSKDLIIRGGMNISPEEIETLIQGHPAVAEVAVVGYPDKNMGERVCACVVVRPGQEITLEGLSEFLKEKKIAVFKLPEKLLIMPALPRNPVGKLLKDPLRQQVQD